MATGCRDYGRIRAGWWDQGQGQGPGLVDNYKVALSPLSGFSFFLPPSLYCEF